MRKTRKGNLIKVLALMMAAAFVGAVWGHKNSSPGVFMGMIAKMDLADNKVVVQNMAAK